jgi:hypothetical protein
MRRVRSAVLTLGLVAAAVALQAGEWSYSRAYGPFTKDGPIGRMITTPRFGIQVEQVQAARSVRVPGDEFTKASTVPANGVFVVVIATLESRTSRVYVADAVLRTKEGDYDTTDKFGGGLLSGPAVTTLPYLAVQPGMPRRGAYVFDVPAGALAGARLVVSDRDTQPANFGYYRRDPVRFSQEVHVDLGLDAGAARRLVATAPDSYGIPDPS